jgi:hypothetical protein
MFVLLLVAKRVRKKLRFRAQYRCAHFVMSTQLPGMDPANGARSLELFARKVMPPFRPLSK